MSKKALPMIIFLAFLWGSTMVSARFSLDYFEVSTFIAVRMLLAGFVFLLAYPLVLKRPLPRDWNVIKYGVFLGIFGTALPMNLFVHALNYQSSGITSVLSALSPAFVAILAHFMVPDEHSSRKQVLGIIISFSGAILLIALGENGLAEETASFLGFFLIIVAVVSGGLVDVYTRLHMTDCDAADLTMIRTITAAVIMLPVAWFVDGFNLSGIAFSGWLGLLYATIAGTIMAFFLSLYNIQKFGVTTASTVTYIIPLFATVGGWLLLDEIVTSGMLIGMSLIIVGVWILNRRTHIPLTEIGD